MKKIDLLLFAIMTIVVSFLFFGCSKKEVVPANPVVQIPVGCAFDPIPPLKMMVKNPNDDIEIDLRIQEQSDFKTSALLKCKKQNNQ